MRILDKLKSTTMIIRMTLLFVWSMTLSLSTAQIGAKVQQKSSIYGIWQNSQYGFQMTLIIHQDGTGEFDGEAFTFTFSDSKISMLSGNETVTYGYSLQGNTLILSGGDLTEQMTFSREGSPSNSTSTDIVLQQNTGATNIPTVDSPSSDIIGVWSGNGETIEFKSSGECAYLGQVFPYHLLSGYVSLATSQGDVSFQYTVKGDQLSLSGNNNTVTYSRGTSSSDNLQQQPPTGNGQVAMELVGKWCFANVNSYNQGASSSSECVTLNADGTYLYYSESSRSVNTGDFAGGTASQNEDRGTWYFQGDRLYVHSQTIGDASYRLEKRNHPKNGNDPMIVLDGRTFVTAYNKPPWR